MKNNTQKKNKNTHVRNLKRQLMTKDFLWRLKMEIWVTGTNGLWSLEPDLLFYQDGKVDKGSC